MSFRSPYESELYKKVTNLVSIDEYRKEKILNILYSMNIYEMKALEEFIHQIGKEYKKKATLEKIEKLKKELEEEEK